MPDEFLPCEFPKRDSEGMTILTGGGHYLPCGRPGDWYLNHIPICSECLAEYKPIGSSSYGTKTKRWWLFSWYFWRSIPQLLLFIAMYLKGIILGLSLFIGLSQVFVPFNPYTLMVNIVAAGLLGGFITVWWYAVLRDAFRKFVELSF